MNNQPDGDPLSVMTATEICEMSDLPRWTCVHCEEWGQTHASLPPVAPDKPRTITGWWTISYDGRAGHQRKWTGLSRKADRPDEPVIIECGHDQDIPLCGECVKQLVDILADVPALIHDLDVAIIRDTTFVEHGATTHPHPDQGEPKPWNERASRAKNRLVESLAGTCRTTSSGCWTGPSSSGAAHARHITKGLGRIARRDDAPAIARDISSAVAAAHRAIDRPNPAVYYGLCPDCGEEIRAARISKHDRDARITCANPGCQYSATYADHLVAMLEDDRLLTVDELVGAITYAGEVATRAQIERWVATEGVLAGERVEAHWEGNRIVSTPQVTYSLADIRRLADGENLDAHKGTVTSREVAAMCGITEESVRKQVERGKIEPVRKGTKPLRFTEAEAERFKAERKAS